ncbi:RRP12-like protein [Pseudolycoriella hygida]|uniref:RRP12-like protein n=1 Tax=Pseudolycoriella hygida TaxID=35572 RepID=A0A9Q0RUQ7_9DIPT|nr:RRP12-like protein [Pseudolycoriella hygida]
MGKFRSKLKRHSKGKLWGHGQSATSNPAKKKHRTKAQSRFFQPNLSLAPSTEANSGSLTLDAIKEHDVRLSYAVGNEEPTVNDIASSLKSFNFGGEDEGMTELGSFKTFKTFASNYSACTNMTFSKLLVGFRSDSPLHKEMLAILAALTEVIKERGGNQTSTEYFLALMETLDAAKEDNELVASVSLLAMGIKTVPEAVLRKKFGDTANLLMELMKRFAETDNQIVLRGLINSMAALLRAQEYSIWTLSSTLDYFDAIMAFVIHVKPKIRKSAQHAVASIIHGSSFMQSTTSTNDDDEMEASSKKFTFHPASGRIATFSIQQFKPENIAKGQTIVLHTLGLLRDTLGGFKVDDIKTVCEHLLSIMTAANVLIRTNCLETLYALFKSSSSNLSANLIGKLITALYEYRPDRLDPRQTLAWLTVVKEAHVCLSGHDLTMCVNALPKLMDICASDLWMNARIEIVQGTSNAIKELFTECIKPACLVRQLADDNRNSITKCIKAVSKALSVPFGHVATHVVQTFAVVFDATGRFFGEELIEPMKVIGERYDADSAFRLHIEHAILAAIPTMGPENVLKAVPLLKNPEDREVLLDRSWILPLLREGISESTFEFFDSHILKLAAICNQNWKKYQESGNNRLAHVNELLCSQLWSLFPGFCRKPRDMFNFKLVARNLGGVLTSSVNLRAPILDGLKELLTNVDDDGKEVLGKFSKNFLPILFNIYSTKPNGSYESVLRTQTMEVITEYLKVTPPEKLSELYEVAKTTHASHEAGSFASESIFDIIDRLAVYQSSDQLKQLFDDHIDGVLKRKTKKPTVAKSLEKLKKQQRKAYELLLNILTSTTEGSVEFVDANIDQIKDLVLQSLKTTCNTTQAARLNCIKFLIDKLENVSSDEDLIKKTIPEIIVAYNHGTSKKDNTALNLILRIGEIYQNEDKLNDFVDVICAGFGGDSVLISNTILTLKAVIAHFTGNLTVATIQFLLDQILAFLVGKNRSEVNAAVIFLISFIKVLPSPLVANHLTTIVKSLSSMVPDTKRYCRVHIGYILKKLCKKFTAEEIVKLVPGNDEVTHKKLKNIRKQMNRQKRQKSHDKDDSSDEEDVINSLEKKSHTMQDILADSDSDLDDDMEVDKPKPTKKSKHSETYIQEDPDSIVDLIDINSISKISSTKPLAVIDAEPNESEKKKKEKDANRGFKTAPDGRLIIADLKRGAAVSDSDDDKDKPKQSESKKRSLESDDSSDEEDNDEAVPSRKRKASDLNSVASSRYVTGGKGIHRSMATASVKSGATGVSRISMGTTKSASTAYGGEYVAKKAKGDMKKKGKLDPYAYIPLTRNVLNKRKKAKNAGQFKGIVAGARKGAAAGSKTRIQKAYKNKK